MKRSGQLMIITTLLSILGPSFALEPSVIELVYKWAPQIWLHRDEVFYPSSVEFFMPNVDIYDENGTMIQLNPTLQTIVTGNETASYSMSTKIPLDCPGCTNVPAFSGQPVANGGVPTYAVVLEHGDADSTTDIAYEAFYPYNRGKPVCIGVVVNGTCEGYMETFGNHVGDWEKYSIRLQNGQPKMAYLSVHSFGAFYEWNEAEGRFEYYCGEPLRSISDCNDTSIPYAPFLNLTEDGHPIAFSANGSHGLWAEEGEYEYMRLLSLTDYTNAGTPWKTWENLVLIEWTDSEFAEDLHWVNYLGSWGNSKDGCAVEFISGECILGGGPGGPDKPDDFGPLY